jgi:hypothetical protein
MQTDLNADGTNWHYQFNQSGLKAEPNVPYILKFKGWSSSPRSNGLVFEDTPANTYNRYGASTDPEAISGRSEWLYSTITEPKWFTFHVTFDQMVPTTVQKIQWMLSTADATAFLDSVMLIKDGDPPVINTDYLTLSPTQVNLPDSVSSKTVTIFSNATWTASSDQTWLTLSPTAGTGNGTLTIIAQANLLHTVRTAQVNISVTGLRTQSIRVIQEGQSYSLKTLSLTAGGLLSHLTTEELTGITHIFLSGTIDARDFKTMRDEMPLLEAVDLSQVTILEYSGGEGTAGIGSIVYPANVIPDNAFRTPLGLGKISLKAIILPSSITSIGVDAFTFCSGLTSITIPTSVITFSSYAFSSCSGLTDINIPASLASIGSYAFQNCHRLTSVEIPMSVSSIGEFAFNYCSAFISVDDNNPNYSSLDGILYNKDKTSLINCPTSITGSYRIPSSVTSIESSAFSYCKSLTSITIPSSVTSISHYVFLGCNQLSSIYTNSEFPINLSSSTAVFYNVNKGNCRLYIPYGSSGFYAAANQWQDFTTFIEMPGITLPSKTIQMDAAEGSTSTVEITCATTWTVSSDQSWLVVSPSAGYGNKTLTLTAEGNSLVTDRTALITVYASGMDPQTIFVTQNGKEELTIEPIDSTQVVVSSTQVNLTAKESKAKVDINSNSTCTAISDQSWLIVNPLNGSGTQTLTFTIEANQTGANRSATVTIYASGVSSQTITITQESVTGTEPIISNQQMMAYPNPTNGKVNLVFDQVPDDGTFLIVNDLNGKTILKQFIQNKIESINLEGNRPGIYILNTNLKNFKVQKVILK